MAYTKVTLAKDLEQLEIFVQPEDIRSTGRSSNQAAAGAASLMIGPFVGPASGPQDYIFSEHSITQLGKDKKLFGGVLRWAYRAGCADWITYEPEYKV